MKNALDVFLYGFWVGIISALLIIFIIAMVTPPQHSLSNRSIEACQFAGYDTAMVNEDGVYCVRIEPEHVKLYTK